MKKGNNITSTPAVLYISNIDSNQYPSSGAHDSALVLAVGLEMLRALAHSTVERTIIFSFLNCEEPGPLGAASLQQLDWYNRIQFMVNYFNPGLANGLPILHHYTGDNWVPKVYKKASSEYGFFKANSLFMDFPDTKQEEKSSSPLIRGGKVSSVFISNQGNIQFDNTIMDKYETIPNGIMQWSGELFLSMMKILSFSEDVDSDLKDMTSQPKLYFYDIAGHSMVILSRNVLMILCISTAIVSITLHVLYSLFISNHPLGVVGNLKKVVSYLFVVILTYLLIVAIIIAGTMVMLPNRLFYFRSPKLANTYWILLACFSLTFVHFIMSLKKVAKFIRSDDDEFSLLISLNLFWTLTLTINWWIPAYKTLWSIFFFFALMSNLGVLVIIILKRYTKKKLNWTYTPRNWLISFHFIWFTISISLPSIILVSCLKDLQNLLLPDVGLNNSVKVGVIMGLFIASLLLNVIPVLNLIRFRGILFILTSILLAVIFISLAVQPTYDKSYPKRVIFDEIEKHHGEKNVSYYLQISSDDSLPMKPYLQGIFPETAECDEIKCILRKEVTMREYPEIAVKGVFVVGNTTTVKLEILESKSLYQDYSLYFNASELDLTHVIVDNEKLEWGQRSENEPEFSASSIPIRYKRGLNHSMELNFIFKGTPHLSDMMLFSVYMYDGPTQQFMEFIDSISDHPMVAVMGPSHYRIEKKTAIKAF